MIAADAIESVLVDYLQTNHVGQGPLGVHTDLIDSGWLDSLLVMDLVCFIESRFGVRMTATDISPGNLRNVKCLAECISRKQARSADAA
jgi:acyl carrier protein